MTVVSLNMAYRSFREVLAGSHPPRYAASLKPSSPRFTHSSVDATVAVADTRGADLLDASLKDGLVGSTRAVVVSRGVHLDDPAGSSDRDVPLSPHVIDELALATRPQSFRRMTECSSMRPQRAVRVSCLDRHHGLGACADIMS